MSALPWLDPDDDNQPFPDPAFALREPDGLLAVGGNLSPRRLLRAYRQGIFPWYSLGQPILWWSPDPRTVLFPERIKISRSLRKVLRKREFRLTMDEAFTTVVQRCGEPRGYETGTWITPEINQAYCRLHELGFAHSVESWRGSELIGGLYGVALGRVFYGESMFNRASNASKVALVGLARHLQHWGYRLIDCQMYTDHLASFGAEEICRERFMELLDSYCAVAGRPPSKWSCDDDLLGFRKEARHEHTL
jgi:leucyl/phenylalanyl-tRNA--protein transferase